MSQQKSESRQRKFFKIVIPESKLVGLSQWVSQGRVFLHQHSCAKFVKRTIIKRKLLKLFFEFLGLFDVGCIFFEFRILHKRLPHHLLHIHILAVIKIQNDLISYLEFRGQVLTWVVHHSHHLFRIRQMVWIPNHYNNATFLIKASSACSPRHLHIFWAVQKSVASVRTSYFFYCVVNNRFSRHVDPHSESLCSKQHFDQSFRKEELYYLLG